MNPAWLCLVVLRLQAPTETSMLAEIERLDQRLAQAEATTAQAVQRRDIAQTQLDAIEVAAQSSRCRKAQAWAQFRRRIRALARLPPSLTPALWKGASSFDEAVADTRLLRAVAAHDRRLHQQLLAQAEALDALEQERAQQQRLLDDEVAHMNTRRANLSQQRLQRQRLLESIRTRKPAAVALGAEATAARATLGATVSASAALSEARDVAPVPSVPLQTNLQKLQPQNPATGLPASSTLAVRQGNLVWPAVGPIRVAFGERIDLAYGTITAHNGWDIGAPAGSQVQAIAPGRVVYADWLRGYGQVVIVDHGDAFHAIVAHLASVEVTVGDTVMAGQTLGTVGDTGSLRGPVLYFELRHRGTPVDPRRWLRRSMQN